MKFMIALIFAVAITANICEARSIPNGYEYRVYFESREQFELINVMDLHSILKLTLWNLDEEYAECIVAPEMVETFKGAMVGNNFKYKLLSEASEDVPAALSGERVHYFGHKVFRVEFKTDEQFNMLKQMKDSSSEGIMFWQLVRSQHYADIMVAPEKIGSFLAKLDKFGFTYKVKIEDVEKSFVNNVSAVEDTRVHYFGFKVFRVQFTTVEQFNMLKAMKDSSSEGIMFWQLVRSQNYADIMVAPEKIESFLAKLDKFGFTYKVEIEDVEKTYQVMSGSALEDTRVHYDGYKVFRVEFKTEEQFNMLRKMRDSSSSEGIMFWQLYHSQKCADIMVAPEKIESFLAKLEKFGFTYKVQIEDVEKSFVNNVGASALKDTRTHYFGYKVFRVEFKTVEQFNMLKEMKDSSSQEGVMFWQLVRSQNYADIMVAPEKIELFLAKLEKFGFTYKVEIEDVEKTYEVSMGGSALEDTRVHYDGYKVFRVEFKTEEQFKILNEIEMNSEDISFWQLVDSQSYADIMVSPAKIEDFLAVLKTNGLVGKVSINDVEKLVKIFQYSTSLKEDLTHYYGYKVFRVGYTKQAQFYVISEMNAKSKGETVLVSFWQEIPTQNYAIIMVRPNHVEEFLAETYGFSHELLIEESEKLINLAKRPIQIQEERTHYYGFKVYRIHFKTEEQFKILFEMEQNSNEVSIVDLDSHIHTIFMIEQEEMSYHILLPVPATDAVSFWQLSHLEHFADVLVAPAKIQHFLTELDNFGFSYDLLIDDVEKEINGQ